MQTQAFQAGASVPSLHDEFGPTDSRPAGCAVATTTAWCLAWSAHARARWTGRPLRVEIEGWVDPDLTARDAGMLGRLAASAIFEQLLEAGSLAGQLSALPGDRQLVAFAEPFDVSGDDALDPLQAFLICGFGAQGQGARGGVHGALAPAEADHPAGFGAFDVLDLWRRLPVTAVIARPVAQAMDLLGMFAKLGDVAARVFGLDLGFGGEHGSPFGVGLWTVATHSVLSRHSVIVKSDCLDTDGPYA
jgi:hypothetical protein